MKRTATERRRTGDSSETIADSSNVVESPPEPLLDSVLPLRDSSSDVPVVDGTNTHRNDAAGAE